MTRHAHARLDGATWPTRLLGCHHHLLCVKHSSSNYMKSRGESHSGRMDSHGSVKKANMTHSENLGWRKIRMSHVVLGISISLNFITKFMNGSRDFVYTFRPSPSAHLPRQEASMERGEKGDEGQRGGA